MKAPERFSPEPSVENAGAWEFVWTVRPCACSSTQGDEMLNSKRNSSRYGVRVCHRECIGEGTEKNKTIRAREKREWKSRTFSDSRLDAS